MMDRNNLQALLKNEIRDLCHYFNSDGLESYDPNDIYETKVGRQIKEMWLTGQRYAFIFAVPLQLVDILFPKIRYLTSSKRIQPICIAQTALAKLILLETSLKDSIDISEVVEQEYSKMLAMAVHTNNGTGWGINIDWWNKAGHMPANTPCHTQTAYAFTFVDKLNSIQPRAEYSKLLLSIAGHTSHDFLEFLEPCSGETITGYSLLDRRPVINASSYRASILLRSHELFGDKEFMVKGLSSLRYVLKMQNKDGSWFYSPDEKFIDGYHTCFVLKNLVYTRDVLQRSGRIAVDSYVQETLQKSIDTGLEYYLNNLRSKAGLPKPFSVINKPCLYQYDSYDLAEAVNLLALFKRTDDLEVVLSFIGTTMKIASGGYKFRFYQLISRVFSGITYNRYANCTMLLAMAKALHTLEDL